MERNGVHYSSSCSSNAATTSGQQPSNRKRRSSSSSGMAQKRRRIFWKQEKVDKTFLEACLHEITINGRKSSSLKASSWKNVGERLKTEHNFIADQKQMKNRYDYLKAKFAAWKELKNKTGNVYDPITNRFNLKEEEWRMEIKSNKYVKALRTAPLLYPDLCTQLFDKATSDGLGLHGWGPSSLLPHPSVKLDDLNFHEDEDTSDSEASSEESSKNGATKRKGEESLDSTIIEIGEEIRKVARLLLEKHNGASVDACFEKLEKFEWGNEDPRYITAACLFGESVNLRRVWLCLNPESCETWLRNTGRKYGYGLL